VFFSLKTDEMATIRKPNPLNRLKNVKTPRSRGGANSRTCPNPSCGATGDKITDDADKRVCTECGTVLSDSNIVSEVQFGETSSGAAVVQGSYIGADQTHARSLGTAFKRAGGMESRDVTDANGKTSALISGLRRLANGWRVSRETLHKPIVRCTQYCCGYGRPSLQTLQARRCSELHTGSKNKERGRRLPVHCLQKGPTQSIHAD